jgi:hypothetical protein
VWRKRKVENAAGYYIGNLSFTFAMSLGLSYVIFPHVGKLDDEWVEMRFETGGL